MNTMGRLGSYISKGVYTVSGSFHPFGGAVDIIVVEQPDGSFKSSPWYVRFGKFQGVLKAKEKVVTISVNGVEANFCMYLDQRGEAYFLREVEGEEGEFLSSPSSSSDEMDGQSLKTLRPAKSKSCNFDGNFSNLSNQKDGQSLKTPRPMKSESCNYDASDLSDEIDGGNGKVVARTNSRRSRIIGLVFGRRSMKEDSFPEGDDGSGVARIGSLERAEIAADLLELRWSTNLASIKHKKGNSQQFSGLSTLTGMGDNDLPTSNELRQMDSSARGSSDISMDNGILAEEVEPQKEIVEKISKPDFETLEDSVVEAMTALEVLGTKVKLVEKSMLKKSVLYGTIKTIHEIPMNSNESSLQNAVDDAGDFPEVICHNPQMPVVDELYHGEKLDKEHASDEKDIALPACGILKDDNKLDELQSIVNCATSQSLELVMDGIKGRTLKKVHFSGDEPEEVQPETFQLLQKDSVYQQADNAQWKRANLDASDISQQINPSLSFMNGHDYSNPEVPAAVSNLDVPVVNVAPTTPPCDAVEPQSNNTTSSYQSKDGGSTGDLNLGNELQHALVSVGNRKQQIVDFSLKKAPSDPVSESSDEEQFLFSDLDNFKFNKIEYQAYFANGVIEEGIDETYGMSITHAEAISSSEVVQMNALGEIQNSLERSAAMLSPLGFPDDHSFGSSGAERLAKSLPNISSHIDKSFETNPHHPVSHSLDSISSPEEWSLHKHDEAGSSSVNTGKDNQLTQDHFSKSAVGDSSNVTLASDGSWRMWPFSFKRSRSRRTTQPAPVDTRNSGPENIPDSTISIETRDSSVKNYSDRKISMNAEKDVLKPKVTKRTVRAITPTSEQLASLNLKDGRNIVTFTFCTTMLGTQEVDARIYLWKWNTQIVISDVDGTITKSDVLGQFMPLVGVDWSQTGVANLFSAIKENGYQLLFLSARAISQAYHTRRFLFNLKQDGKSLPDGPVVISPDGLFPSLFREVIRRAPHEFKIACLEDIKALFPPDRNPFYAGFGNRDTDEISYIKVGIPKGKIFIINPKGEVAVNRRVDTKSYSSLHDLVHGMFPSKPSFEQEDFNSWNYWKLPPPLIDI